MISIILTLTTLLLACAAQAASELKFGHWVQSSTQATRAERAGQVTTAQPLGQPPVRHTLYALLCLTTHHCRHHHHRHHHNHHRSSPHIIVVIIIIIIIVVITTHHHHHHHPHRHDGQVMYSRAKAMADSALSRMEGLPVTIASLGLLYCKVVHHNIDDQPPQILYHRNSSLTLYPLLHIIIASLSLGLLYCKVVHHNIDDQPSSHTIPSQLILNPNPLLHIIIASLSLGLLHCKVVHHNIDYQPSSHTIPSQLIPNPNPLLHIIIVSMSLCCSCPCPCSALLQERRGGGSGRVWSKPDRHGIAAPHTHRRQWNRAVTGDPLPCPVLSCHSLTHGAAAPHTHRRQRNRAVTGDPLSCHSLSYVPGKRHRRQRYRAVTGDPLSCPVLSLSDMYVLVISNIIVGDGHPINPSLPLSFPACL